MICPSGNLTFLICSAGFQGEPSYPLTSRCRYRTNQLSDACKHLCLDCAAEIDEYGNASWRRTNDAGKCFGFNELPVLFD
jgi:hypothetical protein